MVTTKDSMAKNTRKSRSDYILGLASNDPQLEISCRIVEEVLHTLQSCHELTTQTPKGLHVLMGWLTKHYGEVFLHYVSKPPAPVRVLFNEEAQADGRVQWSEQGLDRLTKEFLYYPKGTGYVG